jgi:hypothetical protein
MTSQERIAIEGLSLFARLVVRCNGFIQALLATRQLLFRFGHVA